MSSGLPHAMTLEVRDTCLCLFAQRAARALARRFDQALKPLDLTNGQFSLLMALNRPEPPPISPVAELLAMDRTTLTAALKPLIRRGLVSVILNPRDRRNRLLVLEEPGRQLLVEAFPVWKLAHAEIEAELAEVELTGGELRRGLTALSHLK